jgi:hypothetical protein
MTDRAAREKAALEGVFKSCNVAEAVRKYIIDTLGAASVSDFYGMVSEEKFEQELIELILDNVASAKDNPLQTSRIRAAWRAARTIVCKNESRKQQGAAPEELEEILDDTIQGELWLTWEEFYHFQLDMYNTPSDLLIAKLYREAQRGTATVIQIKRVQCLAEASAPSNMQRRDLGHNIRLLIGEDPDPIMSVYRYYLGLRVLANAYALTGQHMANSKVLEGKSVRFSPWAVNVQYAEYCLRKVMTTSMQPHQQLDWLQLKDEATRTKMVEHIRFGYPQGEALTKALQEMEVAWTIGPAPARAEKTDLGGQQSSQDGPPEKKPKHAQHDGKLAICKPFNDARGCKKKCPQNKAHVCDAIKADGTPCLSTKHSRPNHR